MSNAAMDRVFDLLEAINTLNPLISAEKKVLHYSRPMKKTVGKYIARGASILFEDILRAKWVIVQETEEPNGERIQETDMGISVLGIPLIYYKWDDSFIGCNPFTTKYRLAEKRELYDTKSTLDK